jgi:hypothetical protein
MRNSGWTIVGMLMTTEKFRAAERMIRGELMR